LHDFDTGNKTMLRTKSLYLNPAFWKENIDLFYVPKLLIDGWQGIVVSERLKTILEQNEITGIWRFTELSIF
jgi:hypothetical protein